MLLTCPKPPGPRPLRLPRAWRAAGAVRCCLLLAASLGFAAPGLAQRKQVELTPSIGFQFAGDYEYDDFDFGFTRIGVEASESLGITLDLPISRRMQIELMVVEQDTTLEIEDGVGVLDPDEVTLDFYHAGVLYQAVSGQVRPFGVIAVGATRIAPGITRLDTEYKPSMSIGGGVKFMLSEHFGIRLEGRAMITPLEERDEEICCYGDFCCEDRYSTTLLQGRIAAGAVIAF